MDSKTTTFTFTFFTLLLLYTVSAARPCMRPHVTKPTPIKIDAASKLAKASGESAASAGSKIFLPREKVNDETSGSNLHHSPEKIMKNDLAARTNFSRFHPINRHFQGRPHRGPRPAGTHSRPGCMKSSPHMVPQKEVSHEVTAERSDNSRSKTFRGEAPENWLKLKHHYGTRRQHNNNNNNHTNRDNQRTKSDENVTKTKNVLDREKMKSLNRQMKLKKNNGKTRLMKNIRKFLKHTFD